MFGAAPNGDSQTLGRYAPNALIPPSSNPADIYRALRQDVSRKDMHSAKINEQKASFTKLARVGWTPRNSLSKIMKIFYT